MDGAIVSGAWLNEFFRLRGKVFVDQTVINKTLNELDDWSPNNYEAMQSYEEMFGLTKKIDTLSR